MDIDLHIHWDLVYARYTIISQTKGIHGFTASCKIRMNITWATYEFEVLNMDGMWKNMGGVYIFSGLKDNSWRAYYVGITDSFQDRHPDHERWEEAKRLGAAHVHARSEPQAAVRERIERELIVTYQPPLNLYSCVRSSAKGGH